MSQTAPIHPYDHHVRAFSTASVAGIPAGGDGESPANTRTGGDPAPVADTGSDADVDAEWASLVARATARVGELDALNADTGQRGRSWSLPVDPRQQARTPVWSGRTQWQRQVRAQLDTAMGVAVCREHHVADRAVFAVAVCCAGFAESRTGRGVTAALDTIAARAGVSRKVAKRSRQVLAGLGMAVEMARGRFLTADEREAAEAHHGGRQTRAASVWALTSPREAVMTTPRPVITIPKATRRRRGSAQSRGRAGSQGTPTAATSTGAPVAPPAPSASTAAAGRPHSRDGVCGRGPRVRGRDPLSRGSSFDLGPLFEKNSPTRAQAHTGGEEHPRRNDDDRARSLSVQRCAAQLLHRIPGLSAIGHVGALCNTLTRAGIDTDRWSGHDIAERLDRDTRERGWVWPTDITAPLALLRWRLTRIDFSGPSPTEQRHHAARVARAAHEQRALDTAQRRADRATPTQRAARLAEIRRQLTERTHATPTTSPTPTARRTSTEGTIR